MPIVPVAANFNKGYASDVARDQLPAGYAYRMTDWIPGLNARLRGRGPWERTSPSLTSVHAGPTYAAAVAWAPFAQWVVTGSGTIGQEHLVIIGDDGSMYRDMVMDGSAAVYLGTTNSHPTESPFWTPLYGGKGALIIPVTRAYSVGFGSPLALGQSTNVYTIQVTGPPDYAVAAMTGSPPAASTGCAWGDYVLLANGDSATSFVKFNYPNRIWISGVGDPTSWTPGTNFWDSENIPDIVRLVPVRPGILVFGYSQTSLITGDTPPAGGNWSEDILFSDLGAWDARSIVKVGDVVVFANTSGVYTTDGVTLSDLTLACGVKTRWQELVANFSYRGGWTASAGIFRNHYIISVHDASNTLVTTHVFDLANHIAYEFSNIHAAMMCHTPLSRGTSTVAGKERLFVAALNEAYVHDLAPCWTKAGPGLSSGGLVDGDGTNVLPVLETPFYKPGGAGKKVFRSVRATYDARSHGGSTPSLGVGVCSEPDGAYTSVGNLPTTTDEDRQKLPIRQTSRGLGLKFTQAGLSDATTLSEIELDLRPLEAMR